MKIIVDADACPKTVLMICKQAAAENNLQLCTVASFNHHINSDYHLVVGDSPQETDIKIVNLAKKGDIVVTQDWGLAAILLGKGAGVISPTGRIFRAKTIDFLLEEREAKAKFRRAGGRTKGPRKRTSEDDERFVSALKTLINQRLTKY
ncbi:YaiI/YqxD family protein [Desulfofalx alkaliphila]|uniref:YaiI/YqxD family protein n=1 Tax=Desulfofalx alkaliphila TaxID=105483 RepID=UPI0004E12EA6|nr:YaiI/YqxD family protein [Desulfofalx alkaliphila]